jgi:alkaline phosphatase
MWSVVLLLIFATPAGAQEKIRVHRDEMPKNIILLIGDGMGLAQIQAGLTTNFGRLNLFTIRSIGFSRTQSATGYVTDSGAGATAISTGHKTYNGAIGVGMDSAAMRTILEYAEEAGKSTGLVSTSSITHATPASFIAHNVSRNNYEDIALDFLKTDIDVFIGGGRNNFTKRKDGRNLVQELRDKHYQVMFSMDSIKGLRQGKLAGLVAPEHNPSIIEGRNREMLITSTQTAINILSKNKKGFFLMVEGSEIDFGGHANNTEYVAQEVIDFDRAIGAALDFAKLYGNTLVIVTADHETGGMAITGGSFKEGRVTAKFAVTDHTGIMVPVFAYGPGAGVFQGIQENTDLFDKMMLLLGLKINSTDQ